MQAIVPAKDGFNLLVRVMPRASRQTLGPMREGRLTVYINAPPVDGAANQALIKFLGKILDISPSSLSIASGHKSRAKTVFISNMEQEEIARKLDEAAG